MTGVLVEDGHTFDILDMYGSAARKTDAERIVAEVNTSAKLIVRALERLSERFDAATEARGGAAGEPD